MKLVEGEKILKEWEYAKSKQGREKTQATLTLTNKRLVSSMESKRKISQTEVPIADIKGLSFSVDNKSNFLAVLCIILGVLTAIVIIGIFLIIKGAHMLNCGAFAVEVSISGEPTLVGGADTGFSGRRNKRKLKVKINRDAVNEIAETLGAYILSNKRSEAV